MNPHDFRIVRALYHELSELPAGERTEFLARGDLTPAIRAELAGLLEEDAEPDAFDDARVGDLAPVIALGTVPGTAPGTVPGTVPGGGAPGSVPAVPAEGEPPATGRTIGGFRIGEVLGRGGMGVVYRALQEHPRREVALKVLGPFAFDEDVRRRFEYEAEILARLDHPCVAKVYQAGIDRSTPEGTPYIAMELVSGTDLLSHCEREGVGIEERLRVFEQVCAGVEHAHQHGIVHRDLKPANVLVSEDGRPRILDFGIARPVQDAGQSTPGRTQPGSILGSLSWMSPEQARGAVEKIDVRSDVYSLGVILHLLLSGEMPYDVGDVRPWEAAEIICEREPKRLGRLDPALRGDLELIAAMALEKEPARRYPSAGALGRDVRRFLDDQPIEARPWSAAYQLRKFARRHRLLIGSAALLLASILAGLGAAVYLWLRSEDALAVARSERLTSERVLGFLVGMFEQQTPESALGETVTVRQVLDDVAPRLRYELAGEPEVRARLMGALGQVYESLGLLRDAEPLLDGARETALASFGPDHPETLAIEEARASLLLETGRYDEAAPLLLETERRRRRVLGDDHPQTLDTLRSRAHLAANRGRLPEAVELAHEAAEGYRRALGEDAEQTLEALKLVGALRRLQGRFEEAEELDRAVVETLRDTRGEDHPDTLDAKLELGRLLVDRGRLDEAELLLVEAVDGYRRIFPDDHVALIRAVYDLANLHGFAGRLDEAEELYVEALEKSTAVLGREHPNTLSILHELAGVRYDQGRPEEAERLALESLEGTRRHHGDAHASVHATLNLLGILYVGLERHADAERVLLEVRGSLPGTGAEAGPHGLAATSSLANLYRNTGRFGEAEPLYLEALEGVRATMGEDHPNAYVVQSNLADCYLGMERVEEGLDLAREAIEGCRRSLGDDHPLTLDLLYTWAETFVFEERLAEAAELYEAAAGALAGTRGEDHRATLGARRSLADVLLLQDRFDEAEAQLVELVEAYRRTLGRGHPDALEALGTLATVYLRLGRAADAEARALELVADAPEGSEEHRMGTAVLERARALRGEDD